MQEKKVSEAQRHHFDLFAIITKTHNVTDSVIQKPSAGRLCLWRTFKLSAKPLDWSSDYALKLNLCSNSGVGLGGGATI